MTITDLSSLPRPARQGAPFGTQFTADTTSNPVADLVETVVAAAGAAGDNKPHAVEGTRWRVSMAGSCMRQNAYYMTGTERTDPIGTPDYYRMSLGTATHERMQQAFAETDPTLKFEVPVDLRPIGVDGSGSVDVYDETNSRVIEIKTMNGFGFKKLAAWSNPTGPRLSHVLQAGLYARVLGATEIVLLYLNQEVVSPAETKKNKLTSVQRYVATFTIPMADIDSELDDEIARLQAVFNMLDASGNDPTVVPRYEPEMPRGARVVDPKPVSGNAGWQRLDEAGVALQTGNTWRCNYCSWQDRCYTDLRAEVSKESGTG